MKYLNLILSLCLLLSGCHKKLDDYDTSNPILVKAYSSTYFYPADFYSESIDSGSIYYVNTISIKPVDQREPICIDLCSNDIAQARTWSELTNTNSSQNRLLKDERQTEKYFEFKRVSPINKIDMVLDRVHKKSYFIPLMDRYKAIDTIGQIPESTLQSTDIKQYIDYLWSSGIVEGPTKVIETKLQDTTIGHKYTIKSITIVGGDRGIDDIIHVYRNTFLIYDSDGIIRLEKSLIEDIVGKHR